MTVQDNDEWVLVPKEPTKAMLDAVWAAELDIYWNYCSNEKPGGPADVYRAMLAAAPSPPSTDRIAVTCTPDVTIEFCQKVIGEMSRIIGDMQSELNKWKTP